MINIVFGIIMTTLFLGIYYIVVAALVAVVCWAFTIEFAWAYPAGIIALAWIFSMFRGKR